MRFILFTLSIVITFSLHAIEVKPIAGDIGVEIHGLDFSLGIQADEVALIRQLLNERLVVIVKKQNLSAEQQSRITAQFGDIEIAWDKKNRHPHDCHLHVSDNQGQKKHQNYTNSALYWHWDKSFIQYPSSISFAFFPSEPQPEGLGATGFLNAYAIYENLPQDLKNAIDHLSIVHAYMSDERKRNYENVSLDYTKAIARFPEVVHPIVRVHPRTGRFTLNFDELAQGQIMGMDEIESADLKKRLSEHVMSQNCFYYHVWETGDFVIWDNLALLHRRTPNDLSISRILNRTNVSSRAEIEGSCFLAGVDLTNEECCAMAQKLFAEPFVLESDAYDTIAALEHDVELLRIGHPVQNISPHPIVILLGEKWKRSPKLVSLLHAAVLHRQPEDIFFPYKVKIIQYSKDCGEQLENVCVAHYLAQDAHERLLSGELSFEYLDKKSKIFTSSYKTYANADGIFSEKRQRVHTKLIEHLFKNTRQVATRQRWVICFYRGDDSNRQKVLNQLLGEGEQPLQINHQIFFDFLFQDVPNDHKKHLWTYLNDEIQYLMRLISKIAMMRQIPIVIDIPILSHEFAKELVDSVKQYGAHTALIGFCDSLDSDLIYQQLVLNKVLALNWKHFVSNFDESFVFGNQLWQFLRFGFLDPDELASELSFSDPKERDKVVEKRLEAVSFEMISKLRPDREKL